MLFLHLPSQQNGSQNFKCSEIHSLFPGAINSTWKKKVSEIELYYSDVVAVEASVKDPECYQIYRIDVPQGQIVPLDEIVFPTREEAAEQIREYGFLQLSYPMLQDELRRMRYLLWKINAS